MDDFTKFGLLILGILALVMVGVLGEIYLESRTAEDVVRMAHDSVVQVRCDGNALNIEGYMIYDSDRSELFLVCTNIREE